MTEFSCRHVTPPCSACPLSLVTCPLSYPSFSYLVLMLLFACLFCEMGFDSRAPAGLELKISRPTDEHWCGRNDLPCLAFFAFASLFPCLLPHISYWFCFDLSLFSLSLVTHFSFLMIFAWSLPRCLCRYWFGDNRDFPIALNTYQGKPQLTIGSRHEPQAQISHLDIQDEDFWDWF